MSYHHRAVNSSYLLTSRSSSVSSLGCPALERFPVSNIVDRENEFLSIAVDAILLLFIEVLAIVRHADFAN